MLSAVSLRVFNNKNCILNIQDDLGLQIFWIQIVASYRYHHNIQLYIVELF